MDEKSSDAVKDMDGVHEQQMFTLAVAEIKPKDETLSLKVGGVEVLPYLAGSAAIGAVLLVSRAIFGGGKKESRSDASVVMNSEEFERLIAAAVKDKVFVSPTWWNPPPSSFASDSVKEAKKAEAELLLSKIEQQKNLGKDYSLEDIIRLRGLSQESGAALKPKTVGESLGLSSLLPFLHHSFDSGARDAIFKTAVEAAVIYAQDQTDMSGEAALLASFDGGEKPETRFITALAGDLGLEDERAVLITQGVAASAARARLLDAVKSLKENNEMDALVALIKLSNLVQHIPVLQANGPEPELIASSLRNASSIEERKKILYLLGQLYLEGASVWTYMLGFGPSNATSSSVRDV